MASTLMRACGHCVGKVSIAQQEMPRRAGPSRSAAEVPVGHGDLDWLQLLALLRKSNIAVG